MWYSFYLVARDFSNPSDEQVVVKWVLFSANDFDGIALDNGGAVIAVAGDGGKYVQDSRKLHFINFFDILLHFRILYSS